MNRLDEIDHKHAQIRRLLEARGADSLLIRRTRNIAWFTGGADASIAVDGDYGAYHVLVTPDRRAIVADNIEETRLRAEEDLESLGFDFEISPWYARDPVTTPRMATDDGDIADDLQQLRVVLLPPEIERARLLGRDTAAAIEQAARAVRPGDTEHAIAARLVAACRERGGQAVVSLVGTDERISRHRHPLPTARPLERVAMLVVCMRRHGLIISATRFVHVGPVPADLQDKLRRVATVDAAVMAAARPGRTLGEVFDDLVQAYADVHEAGQWTFHHQGGLAGYAARERIATPGDPTPVQANQLYAWNPSIVGAKSEDTILVGASDFEIISQASSDWPMLAVTAAGRQIQRPGILEI